MNQGCPGEGSDRRTFGWLICPLQRILSRKSLKQPRLLIITAGTSSSLHGSFYPVLSAAGIWPPYLVINVRRGLLWQMFRIGWRYDKNWKGYIGPSAALKKVAGPLTYY